MGFCRAPVSAHVFTEERRESLKIRVTYPWSPKESPDYVDPVTGEVTEFRGERVELAYTDLPALIRDLQDIERKNYDLCHPAQEVTP